MRKNLTTIRNCVHKHMRHVLELPGAHIGSGVKEIRFVRTRYRHSDAEKLAIATNVSKELGTSILDHKWETSYHWAHGTFDALTISFPV